MRKFYLRWWYTANHEQDRYQQAVREWAGVPPWAHLSETLIEVMKGKENERS